MYKRFLPYDIYERHKKIGHIIGKGKSVVDVGGELEHLSQFCKPSKIIVANLTKGDVIISKDKLPFKNKSFDIACAIDVLEHIPKKDRSNFIQNLVRIAKKQVILSFPISTIKHDEYEKKIFNWLKLNNIKNIKYLQEHIKYGLPSQNDMILISKDFNTSFSYSGNLALNEFLFKIFIIDPKIKYLRKIIYYLKFIFNFITNDLLYVFLVNKKYSQSSNRAYLIINTL